jgi:hypothetical protein
MTIFSRSALILTLACTLLACTESSREQASGKGNIRGVNAIVDVLDTNFLIEERSLDVLPYKGASSARRFDDISYRFNFDIAIPGQLDSQRIAIVSQKITKDHDYVFVAAGFAASPDTFVWERAEREWAGTETVFEMTFAHLDKTSGPFDVYFEMPGTVPVLRNRQGSIAYGEQTVLREFETGEYELILTTPNSPLDIQYSGISFTNPAGQTSVSMVLTADPTITGPISVRQLLPSGDTLEVPDSRFPPTVQLINASLEAGNVDLVIDNDFVNPPAISDHPFGIVSADVDVPAGTTPFIYTAPGDTTALLERDTSIATGRRATIILHGDLSTLATTVLSSERRTLSVEARIRFVNASFNNTPLDLYFSAEGSVFADSFPLTRLNVGEPTNYILRGAGSYEITITAAADKDIILLGPVLIDLENGDIEEVVILDNVDPAIVDLLIYSNLP